MPAVAGEDIVAASAGEQDLDPSGLRGTADGVGGESGEIGRRLIELPDHPVELFGRSFVHLRDVKRHAEMVADLPGIRMIVDEAFGLLGSGLRRQREARVVGRRGDMPQREVGDGRGI